MSTSPGQYSNDALSSALGRRRAEDAPSVSGGVRGRPVDRALAIAERRTLTGALERVADRHAGLAVPEALYMDLSADVPSVLHRLILSTLSAGSMAAAAAICSAVVRLMALQPTRRWLDAQLILRVALLVHDQRGQDLSLLTVVRELLAAQGRWHAASVRHGASVDAGDPEDWEILRELNALPLDFSPEICGLIARSIIRQDLLGARARLASYSRQRPHEADTARRQLNRCAPTLASLFGAELAPTRPIARPSDRSERPSVTAIQHITNLFWPLVMTLSAAGVAALLMAAPPAVESQQLAVEEICRVVGAEHPGCLTASALGTGLDHMNCRMAAQALPVLEGQLSNFGLNREFAVIRTDGLGQFRGPFDALEFSYASRCL